MRMCNGSGMLTRELGVRVINVSGSGCLIETNRRMEVGSVGRLQVRFGDEEYNDDIQVTRCDAVKGARSALSRRCEILVDDAAPSAVDSSRCHAASRGAGCRGQFAASDVAQSRIVALCTQPA